MVGVQPHPPYRELARRHAQIPSLVVVVPVQGSSRHPRPINELPLPDRVDSRNRGARRGKGDDHSRARNQVLIRARLDDQPSVRSRHRRLRLRSRRDQRRLFKVHIERVIPQCELLGRQIGRALETHRRSDPHHPPRSLVRQDQRRQLIDHAVRIAQRLLVLRPQKFRCIDVEAHRIHLLPFSGFKIARANPTIEQHNPNSAGCILPIFF